VVGKESTRKKIARFKNLKVEGGKEREKGRTR